MNRRCIRYALTCLPVVLTAGCYRYVPAEIGSTPPGTGVQILVTRSGAQQAEEAGALDGGEPRVRGTVVGVQGDDLLIRVPVAQRQEGFIVNRIEQSLSFPIGEIVSFQRRELNGLATGLVIGGAVAVVGAMVAVIADPLKGSKPEPPDPDEIILSFPIPLPFGR